MSDVDAPIMRRFESDDVTIERPRRVRAISIAAAMLLVGATSSVVHAPPTFCFSAVGLLGAIAMVASTFRRPRPKARRLGGVAGALDVRASGIVLWLEGTRIETCGPPREGWIESGTRPRVALVLPSGNVVAIALDTEAEAEELISAAGLAANQRVFEAELRSRAAAAHVEVLAVVGALVLVLFTLIALLLAAGGAFWSRGMFIAGVGLLTLDGFLWYKLAASMSTPIATVGTDGIAIRAFGRRELIAYSLVDEVHSDPDGVELVLHDGKTIRLPVAPSAGSFLPARVLRNRIRAAMSVSERAVLAEGVLATLDRADRTFAEWRDELETVLERETGYRGAPIDPAALAGVAADASSPPERRIAAAVALSRADKELRIHVRASATTCADSHLRVAIQRAVEGEIDEADFEAATTLRAR